MSTQIDPRQAGSQFDARPRAQADVQPTVTDRQLRRGDPALLVLIGLLLLRCALIFLGDGVASGLARAAGRPHPWLTGVLFSDVHIVAVDLITLAVLAGLLRRRGRRLRDLVGRFVIGDLARGLLVFVILLVGFVVATYLGNLIVYHGAPPASGATAAAPPLWFGLWTLIVMPVTVALAEELLYRGYLQPEFSSRWGRWPGMIIVAFGFALQHAGLSATSLDAVLARIITTFLAGIVLGMLRWRLQRLTPLIVAHWLLDVIFLGVPVLLLSLGSR